MLGLGAALLGGGGRLLAPAGGLGLGLAALRLGGGLPLRGLPVLLGGLRLLLLGDLVLDAPALLLGLGALVLDLGGGLGALRLGPLVGGLAVGVDGGLLQAALAGEVVVAGQRTRRLLGLSGDLPGDAAGRVLRVLLIPRAYPERWPPFVRQVT